MQTTYTLEAQQAGAHLFLDTDARRATFGSDSRLLITLALDNTFEIRHVLDGYLLHTFNGLRNSQVLDVALSPDGQTLAFSHENGLIKFARPEDGATPWIIEGRSGNGRALEWSPNGQILASYGSELVEVWHANGTLLQTLPVNQPNIDVRSVVFSPDSQILATGSVDGTIKLWQAADGKLLKEIRSQANRIQQMIFRDQGRTLVVSDSVAMLWFWRVSDGSLVQTIDLPSTCASACAFSPDGQIIATDNPSNLGPQVTLWRVADAYVLKNIRLSNSGAVSIAFSADSKQLAIVDAYGKLTLWNTPN